MVTSGRGTGFGRVAKLALLAVAILPLTTGCSVDEVLRFGWPVGITPQAESMRHLWTYSAIAALVVGAITWGMMFWAMAMHRKRKGDTDDNPPRQTQYNVPVEIVFTVVPTIIVAVLFGFTVNVQNYVDAKVPNPDLRVTVTASQWNWQFEYPDTKAPLNPVASTGCDADPEARQDPEHPRAPTERCVSTVGTDTTIPLLVLPTHKRIEFTQRSKDVIHSFWVPEFLFKRDVFPLPNVNDQDYRWQIDSIDREGAFVGRCAELCGSYHSQMNFELRAIPADQYARWLQLRVTVDRATGEPYTAGAALAALNCGQPWCAPQAVTTYPFSTKRTERSASLPPRAGS